jgi:ATP-binding cassette subfamily B protein
MPAVFPFYRQHDAMDCGPACLRMIARYYGRHYALQYLRDQSFIDREGVSLKGISTAAEKIGFRAMGVKVPFSGARDEPSLHTAPLPAIAHWNQNHFVVVYKIGKRHIWIADRARGRLSPIF